jgi:hypothetical protein
MPLPPFLSPRGLRRGPALTKDLQIKAKGLSTPPKSPEVTVTPTLPTLSHYNLPGRGLGDPDWGGGELRHSCRPRLQTRGLQSDSRRDFPPDLPSIPGSHSVFLLLATQRPHWPHPRSGPAMRGSPPPPPLPLEFLGAPGLASPAAIIPGVGRALTIRTRASGPAAGTSRPAGAPQGCGDGGRGGGGAEVGGGQQGRGGWGGGQARLAEAAGHGRGHQATEREGARAVAS